MSVVAQQIERPWWQVSRDLQMPLLVALAYYLGAEAAFFIGTLSDKIFAPFWPPNIVLLCALLLAPPNRWWLFIAAAFPAHAFAELSVGMSLPGLFVAFITNCLVASLNAAAIRLLIGTAEWFGSLRNAALYMFITVVTAPAFAALGGAFVPILVGGAMDNYWHFWAQWHASNALGAATLGPFALTVLSERKYRLPASLTIRHGEALMLVVSLAGISVVAFAMTSHLGSAGYLPTLLYLPLPLILWAAVRFGVTGASGAVLIVGSMLLWRTLSGTSLFNVGDAETNVFAVQIFLIGLSVPILLLAATIAETQQAERSTRESEERMAFAAASSNVGLWIYRLDDGKFWATQHSRTMFGLPEGNGLAFDDLLSAIEPVDSARARVAVHKAIQRRTHLDLEFRVRNRAGETRWIAMRARPHRDGDGTTAEMSGTFADVTKRKQAEEEAALRQQEIAHLMRVSMLGELSGGLAHELTQPLTAILSNAQAGRILLGRPQPELDDLAGILDDIISEDERAGAVIHRLRVLLKKGEVRYETVDVNDLIDSSLHLLHSEFISRRATVQRTLAPDLSAARGDPVQLQQVLLNLFLNAIDAMEELSPSNRIVTVTTAMHDQEVEVRISDRGAGLPNEDQAEIFKPFFTTKRRGLGLGLSICASIIKSHGGSLSLSNNVGDGATATFRLPAHGAEGLGS